MIHAHTPHECAAMHTAIAPRLQSHTRRREVVLVGDQCAKERLHHLDVDRSRIPCRSMWVRSWRGARGSATAVGIRVARDQKVVTVRSPRRLLSRRRRLRRGVHTLSRPGRVANKEHHASPRRSPQEQGGCQEGPLARLLESHPGRREYRDHALATDACAKGGAAQLLPLL